MLAKESRPLFVLFWGIVLLCVILSSQGRVMGKVEKTVKPKIIISVSSCGKEADFPSKDKLVTMGKEIIQSIFPLEIEKSRRVKGEISFIGRKGKVPMFKMDCLFLYKTTYTAVTHHVVFKLHVTGYIIVSVDDKLWDTTSVKSKIKRRK